MKPAITAILTTYNDAARVASTLAGIRAQTWTGFELIVVDDGSRDDTTAIVAEELRSFPAGRLIVQPTNRGVAAARNAAVQVAGGEVIWFADSDDEFDADILTALASAMVGAEADVAVCQADWTSPEPGARRRTIDGLARELTVDGGGALDLVIAGRLRGYLWNKLIRRALLLEHPFPPMTSQSDFAAIAPILAASNRVVFVPRSLYLHVARPGSITNAANVDLGNLGRCRDIVRALAIGSGRYQPASPLLLTFDYRDWHANVITTAARLRSTDVSSEAAVRAARAAMTWRGIAGVARLDAKTALKCAAMKVLGRNYRYLYRVVTGPLRRSRAALALGRARSASLVERG